MDDQPRAAPAGTAQFPPSSGRGWRRIVRSIWSEIGRDRVLLVAAGTTFYLLLALFPAMAAFVSLYGLVADPAVIADHMAGLGAVVPQAGIQLIEERLNILVNQDQDTLSFRFVLAAAVAFWSANSGVKALFEAMNVAFDEREERSFVSLNLRAFGFTLAAMLAAAAMLGLVAVVPFVLHLVWLDEQSQLLVALLRWPVLLALTACGISLLYRYGPSRARSRWRWVSIGGVFATLAWLAVSVGFSTYLARFADYEATYGSLGAVIGFMVWTWLSVVTLIVGAEIDAEIERDADRSGTS
jgi:membrane protein